MGDRQLLDLANLAAMTDCAPLVVALHRYGRTARSLSGTTFDQDLREEIAAITDRHLPHTVERYRQVRASQGSAEAERADETLRHAVERLSDRLHELHDAQHRRDLSGVDEAVRFIDARHPV